jgi:predicted nuclease with TOPRIM domain
MNKSKFKIDTEFVLELQYKYSSLLEELHLRRNEVDKIQKSFRDEAQKKQKEFDDKKESIIYDLDAAKKMVEGQRKRIKQLKEKNKSLTEARDTVVKEMEEAHTLWANSNPGTKLTRHVQIDVKEARRLKDKLKSDNS